MKYRSEQPSEGTSRPSQMSFFNRQTNAQAVIQPKLTVGSAHDAHEHEANRTADMVMRKPDNSVKNGTYTEGSSFMPTITPVIQRACAACEHDKEQTAQRKETGAATGGFTAPPSVSRAISRSGNALDSNAKTFMESRFNRSFDNVQVHTDSDAASSARDISARAYTSGNHIVFGEGQYQPNSEGGRHLLAHELTHVVQQGGDSMNGSVQRACVAGKWKYEYDGCSLPAILSKYVAIDKDNPAGGSDTHFGSTDKTNKGLPCDYHDEYYQSFAPIRQPGDLAMFTRMNAVCLNSKESGAIKAKCFLAANAYYTGLVAGADFAFLDRKTDLLKCKLKI
jgi:hypothetical protein